MRNLRITCIAVALLGTLWGAAIGLAAPSCSEWLRQPDGSMWRTCVDDNGRQYCEQCKGGTCSRVSCR
jgi:hypothetical protein